MFDLQNLETTYGQHTVQSNNKNSNKPFSELKKKSVTQKPSTPKLPLHKKAKEITSNKKQPIKANDKAKRVIM